MNIYLIRHGRQNSPLCNVNVELAEEGKRQAELLGRRLEGYRIDALYSSDLIRAVETAGILNKYLDQDHLIREDIREISFGLLEGKSNEEIESEFADFRKEQLLLEKDIPYPGGECGGQVFERAMRTVEEILSSDKSNVAVVTHGGVIRALVSGLLGLDMSKKLLLGVSLENTSITHLVYNKDKNRFYLQRFNDYAHLEGEEGLLRAIL
ncbi:histidine phosphatase family protein [Anaerocolumna xylanovorans]|uniref:Probable phosphoglycerate mutase n=1 Tax=Anaerocolumna xylanovorans DSM 12503 TaxID=1121345 RepID=A0A1M7YFB7_9FIRM|nr:histidine phosphatase family protein [Anaerocolumna xylanovorans]SHO51334.1 probable phosphoglycerate mutase [Anaerocolumna xylanovorans DSM 12503]